MKLTGITCGFICLAALAVATNAGAQEKPPLKLAFGAPAQTCFTFDFDNGKGPPGHIQITPTNVYSATTGYGLEPGASVTAENQFITSTNPFYFSVKLPEGNYRVRVTFGDPAGESIDDCEGRVAPAHARKGPHRAGAVVTRLFIVNVRTPVIVRAPMQCI